MLSMSAWCDDVNIITLSHCVETQWIFSDTAARTAAVGRGGDYWSECAQAECGMPHSSINLARATQPTFEYKHFDYLHSHMAIARLNWGKSTETTTISATHISLSLFRAEIIVSYDLLRLGYCLVALPGSKGCTTALIPVTCNTTSSVIPMTD